MAKTLRQIIEERMANLYLTAKVLKDDGKKDSSFIGKAEMLESILNEFDGKELPE